MPPRAVVDAGVVVDVLEDELLVDAVDVLEDDELLVDAADVLEDDELLVDAVDVLEEDELPPGLLPGGFRRGGLVRFVPVGTGAW